MSIEDADAALKVVEAGRRRVYDRMQAAFDRQLDGHPELGEVDEAEVDRLIQAAVDRAGAALWRIGLAEGVQDEFGIPVAAALRHPTLAAAQALVGAPEDPLEPSATPAPADGGNAPAAVAVAPAGPDEDDEDDRDTEDDGDAEDTESLEDVRWSDAAAPAPPEPAPEATAVPADPATQALRVPAVHVNGIETLKSGDKDIELRLSDAGLDVLRRSSGVAIGRLEWAEVSEVEIESGKKGLRGRRRGQVLQVRTARGQAHFDLPGLSEEEAAEHLEPLLARLRASGELGSRG